MAIIGLQRRLAEVGRIRIGEQVPTGTKGKTRPKRLETFRITSSNHKALAALAEVYGGSVVPWTDAPVGNQFELYTKADELSVIVPPEAMSFSQFYEVWSGGGCRVRCDGVRDSINEQPCSCDPEDRLCKPHTRLSVMIAEVATSGMWRLDTQGYYAATELGGAFDLAMLMSDATGRSVLRGSLRLDQREVKRPDEPTRKFVVPVLTFDLEAAALGAAALTGGLKPIPEGGGVGGVLGALSAIQDREPAPARKNGIEPVPPTGLRPGGAAGLEGSSDEDEDGVLWSGAQRDEIQNLLDVLLESKDEEATRIFKAWWRSEGIPPLERGLSARQAGLVVDTLRTLLGLDVATDGDEEETGENRQIGADAGKADDVPVPKPTLAKMKAMFALLGSLGFATDKAKHGRVWAIVGHEGSFVDLTRAEVNRVIDQLEEDEKNPEQQGARAPLPGTSPDGRPWATDQFTSDDEESF